MRARFDKQREIKNNLPEVGDMSAYEWESWKDVYIRIEDEYGKKVLNKQDDITDLIYLLNTRTGEIVSDRISNTSRILVEPLEIRNGEIIFVEKKQN